MAVISHTNYYDGIIDRGVFLSDIHIIISGKIYKITDTSICGYQNIYQSDDKYIIVAVSGIVILNTDMQIEKIRDFDNKIEYSFFSKNKLFLFFPEKLEIFDSKLNLLEKIQGHFSIVTYGAMPIVKNNKSFYKITSGKIVSINKISKNINNESEKYFVFGREIYKIDINGDVYKNGKMIIRDKNIDFIKKEESKYIFFGSVVCYENGTIVAKNENHPTGFIYHCFSEKNILYISTYDEGIWKYNNIDFQKIRDFELLSGIFDDNLYFRSGLITNNKKINDEILAVKDNYIFCKNGIYDQDHNMIIKYKDGYFSAMDFKLLIIGSYTKGLYSYINKKLTKLKTPFLGVKKILRYQNNLYIIANDGVYRYENEETYFKIFTFPVTDAIVYDNNFYIAGYKKGIYLFKDNHFEKTNLTIGDLNCYFTNNYIVGEIYHNIVILKYEDI